MAQPRLGDSKVSLDLRLFSKKWLQGGLPKLRSLLFPPVNDQDRLQLAHCWATTTETAELSPAPKAHPWARDVLASAEQALESLGVERRDGSRSHS